MNEYIRDKQPSSIFVIVDDKTLNYCYPYFMAQVETTSRIEVIEIDSGEEHKNLETCAGIWGALVELDIDRDSCIINLGGGVITDMGGFIACTIKRGIDFIHVPTSLLGMVDAAIGGKNGVDIGPIKNQIGVIQPPIMTIIDTYYLQTLPLRELHNGSIEMFKHGLIADRIYWNNLRALKDFKDDSFASLVYQSVIIKSDIVAADPYEKGTRKALNFGHTLGHAIESFCMEKEEKLTLLHGEAVAIGILLESYLSTTYEGLSNDALHEIKDWYDSLSIQHNIVPEDIDEILQYLKYDKKNVNGDIKFVLLKKIGDFSFNQSIHLQDIKQSFDLIF